MVQLCACVLLIDAPLNAASFSAARICPASVSRCVVRLVIESSIEVYRVSSVLSSAFVDACSVYFEKLPNDAFTCSYAAIRSRTLPLLNDLGVPAKFNPSTSTRPSST